MFMKGEHSDWAVEFWIQNLEPKEWLYCWSCVWSPSAASRNQIVFSPNVDETT